MDRLAGIEAFVAAVEENSFTAAARRLGLAKSVVSKQIGALERRLGARLLNRTTRRLSLTEAGARYFEQLAPLLERLAEAERTVDDLQVRPQGRLRLNVPQSFGQLHLAPVMPAFLSRYPGLDVEVSLNDRMVDLVDEGFDAAIRVSRLQDSSLIARRIAGVEGWLCAAPAYLERHGTPQRPADLRRHRCLIYTYAPHRHQWRLTDAAGRIHRVRVSGPLHANNGEFLLEAALQGHGIMLSPDFIAHRAVARGALQRLLPACRAPEIAIHVVYPYTRHVSAKVRAFVDFMLERFGGDRPPWRRVAPRRAPGIAARRT